VSKVWSKLRYFAIVVPVMDLVSEYLGQARKY